MSLFRRFGQWFRSITTKQQPLRRDRPPRRLAVEVLEDRLAPAFGTPILNLAGQGYSGVLPPDTIGDVGVFHYVQATNDNAGTNVTIYNKLDGSIAVPQFNLSSLAGLAGHGDPIVIYDHLADRWLLAELAAVGNQLNFYLSDTGIPTSNPADWTSYTLTTPSFPDYPKITVWPDAYYVGVNDADNAVYALPRDQMLAGTGGAITAIRMTTTDLPNWQRNHIMPADLDGFTLAPAGAPGIFVRQVDDEYVFPGSNDLTRDFLEVWEFHADFVTPANSTYSLVQTIGIADFDYIIGSEFGRGDVEQPGTATEVDSLPHYIMWRLQYRNFGTYETLVANFTVDANEDATPDADGGTAAEQAGVRWFELRKPTGGSWALHQEQTIAPNTDHRWMASAAMNLDGDIAVGYSVSSTTTFPSIRYAGRRTTDTLGTLPSGEITLIAGAGSQTHPSSRWGDYSSMNVDPVDDASFWYTNEYIPAGGLWTTRIGEFAFDDANPTLFATVNSDAIRIVRSGAALQVYYGGTLAKVLTYASIQTLTINGLTGADVLTVDFSLGNPIPTGGVIYNGGGHTGDALVIPGGGSHTATYNYTNAHDGNIQLDPDGPGALPASVITYSGLTPITNNGTAQRVILNLTANADDVTLVNLGGGMLRLQPNNASVELTDFKTPVLSLTVNGLAGADVFQIPAVLGVPAVTINGGLGSDTLVGYNTNNIWYILAPNGGTINSTATGFATIENLTGGSLRDVFRFYPNGNVSGVIKGGAGINWLDYSVTLSVGVNLNTGVATRVFGGVQNINNVIGSSSGGDRLVGNAAGGVLVGRGGANVITAGSGRTVIIGGYGINTLVGGAADDLIINGSTSYDANVATLEAILGIWQGAPAYAARIAALQAVGPNRLKVGLTVFVHPGIATAGPRYGLGNFVYQSTLIGNAGTDWFITRLLVSVLDRQTGEVVTTS